MGTWFANHIMLYGLLGERFPLQTNTLRSEYEQGGPQQALSSWTQVTIFRKSDGKYHNIVLARIASNVFAVSLLQLVFF